MNVEVRDGKYWACNFGEDSFIMLSDQSPGVRVQGQENDVKQVYRSHTCFMEDDMQRQRPYFEKVGSIIREVLDNEHPSWKDIAELVVWSDAVDLYPRLDSNDIYLKGQGLEIALKDFNLAPETMAYICGDGKNDIPMVEWAKNRFQNYIVVAPSNISKDLRSHLINNHINHVVLNEYCSSFCNGLDAVVRSQK